MSSYSAETESLRVMVVPPWLNFQVPVLEAVSSSSPSMAFTTSALSRLFCAMMRFVGAERPINNVRKIIACFIFILSFWIF